MNIVVEKKYLGYDKVTEVSPEQARVVISSCVISVLLTEALLGEAYLIKVVASDREGISDLPIVVGTKVEYTFLPKLQGVITLTMSVQGTELKLVEQIDFRKAIPEGCIYIPVFKE